MSRRPSFLSRLFDPDEVDPESRNKTLLVGGLVAIVVVALALVVVGYYIERVASRGDTVFEVGDRDFSYAYLEDRVDADAARGALNPSNPQFAVATTIADIQNEELFRLLARDRGYTVTAEELDAAMKAELRLSENIEHNEFARILRAELVTLGISLDRYREMIDADVLEEKLRDDIREDVPAEVEQIDLRLILVATEAEALQARERIEGGEPFEDIATEVSQHSTAGEGGSFGWTFEGVLPDQLDEAAFALEPGSLSEVIENESGYFLLRVNAKEMRELDDQQREEYVTGRLDEILDEAVITYGVTNTITNGQMQELISRVQVPRG